MLVNVVYTFITTGIKGDQRFYFPPVLLPSAVSATQYHLAHEEKFKIVLLSFSTPLDHQW